MELDALADHLVAGLTYEDGSISYWIRRHLFAQFAARKMVDVFSAIDGIYMRRLNYLRVWLEREAAFMAYYSGMSHPNIDNGVLMGTEPVKHTNTFGCEWDVPSYEVRAMDVQWQGLLTKVLKHRITSTIKR